MLPSLLAGVPSPAWGPLAAAGSATGKPGGTGGAVVPAASVAAAVEGPEDLWLIPRRTASTLQDKVGIRSVFRLNFSFYATKKLKIVVEPAAQTTLYGLSDTESITAWWTK